MEASMRRFLAPLIVLALTLPVGVSLGQLADSPWPMFRHDLQHTGRSYYRGPETPVLAWSYLTNEIVDSSAALGTDGRVYVGSRDNAFYAFISDGALAWSYVTGGYIPSSPAMDALGHVYFGSNDARTYCLGSSGSLRWSYMDGTAFSEPAITSDGTVYIGGSFADMKLYALTSIGTLRWSYLTAGGVSASPAIGYDEKIYIGSLDHNLYAMTSTGVLSWSYATGDYTLSACIGTDGRVYIGSGDKRLYAIGSNGALAWSFSAASSLATCPALGSGGVIYIGSDDNNFYSLASSGTLLWSYTSGDEVMSSAAIGVDGRLYTGSTDNNFYAFNSNGTLAWSYLTPFSIWSSPAIGSDGRIYAGSNDNNLYVFAGPPPNYINLSVAPVPMIPGDTATFAYRCDFGTWDYEGVPVDIYLAAIKNPLVSDAPSTVSDALGGGTVYLFGRTMVPYLYTGTVREPTFRNIPFPPIPTSGSVSIPVPAVSGLAGNYVFATAFIRRDTGVFVRADGLPVENSNLFLIQ
jgi:outer membrane protein assembly factor BamB